MNIPKIRIDAGGNIYGTWQIALAYLARSVRKVDFDYYRQWLIDHKIAPREEIDEVVALIDESDKIGSLLPYFYSYNTLPLLEPPFSVWVVDAEGKITVFIVDEIREYEYFSQGKKLTSGDFFYDKKDAEDDAEYKIRRKKT